MGREGKTRVGKGENGNGEGKGKGNGRDGTGHGMGKGTEEGEVKGGEGLQPHQTLIPGAATGLQDVQA